MALPFRSNVERIALYAGLALALGLGLGLRESRPALAQNAAGQAAPAIRLATVDVLGIAEKIVGGEKYRTSRDAYAAGLTKPLQDMANELKAMQEKYATLATDSPERKPLEEQFTAKSQAMQAAQQKAQISDEQFKAQQVAEAYRLVIEAADKLGTELGYTHVLATRSGPASIRSDNVPGAVQEILARPLVKGVPADDLTERLMKAMGVEAAPDPVKAQPVTDPGKK